MICVICLCHALNMYPLMAIQLNSIQLLINYCRLASIKAMKEWDTQEPVFSMEVKEAVSRITDMNPEEESKHQFGNFPSPHRYKLQQTLFTMDELTSQQGYNVSFNEHSLYFGGFYKGMKHGLGVLLTQDTTYEGEFSLNFKCGKGYQKFPNGSVYIGDFRNNRTHGEGSLKYNDEYYIGDFQNGSMEGDGMWRNKEGEKYIGQWKSNKAHGYGIYITKASHYQGYVSKFVKHGEGLEQFSNGDVYKGFYQNGVPHGFGEYCWKDGSVYKGDFVQGLRHGKGVWNNSKGDQYQGQFEDDKKNGVGVFEWANGNKYKGEFVNDVRQGEGEMAWSDGSHYKGDWKGGFPNGIGTFRTKGEKGRTGLYENNRLVRQIKPADFCSQPRRQPLVLSVIPEISKKPSFARKNFRSKDMKSRVTNDTSVGWRSTRK